MVESEERVDLWRAAIELGLDTGFMGVGAGRYIDYHAEYVRKVGATRRVLLETNLGVHSDYLSGLVEYGWYGLLFYLYFIATFLRLLWRNLVSSVHPDFFVVVFPLMGFLNLLIQGMFKLTFIFPVYWLALSLFMVLARWASKDR